LDKKELLYLERMAKRMGISEEDFAKILKHPEKYKLEPPLDYNERIEQLYHFTRMIFSDDDIKLNEVKTVRNLATALGFPPDNVEKVTDEAIFLIMNDNNLEEFSKAIKEVNKY
jgi:2-hydroxychromene-2-carboxylate isomerase